jgi:hypothetical protein
MVKIWSYVSICTVNNGFRVSMGVSVPYTFTFTWNKIFFLETFPRKVLSNSDTCLRIFNNSLLVCSTLVGLMLRVIMTILYVVVYIYMCVCVYVCVCVCVQDARYVLCFSMPSISILYSLNWHGAYLHGKDLEKNQSSSEVLSRHLSRGTEENNKKPVRIVWAPAEIRTEHLRNTDTCISDYRRGLDCILDLLTL